MNIFEFRNQLIDDYASYINSFIQIRDSRIRQYVEQKFQEGVLWPEPLIQLNPLFARGESIDELVAQGVLHRECASIFRKGKSDDDPRGNDLRLHKHQSEAVRLARSGAGYVLTTGMGSGKSLSYMIPIVDYVLRNGSGRGIQAIVVYPMNALANSQVQELEKFLQRGYPDKRGPVTFKRYTGQESDEERQQIIANPPDILLTNYVMLELILTRATERRLIASRTLQFLVLDELHTYRGRQGADVALLVQRVRDRLAAGELQCVGTSATLAGVVNYTAWDLKPFAKDYGYNGPPFRWDEERRFLLRCELDAAYFHLYGIEHDYADYIMETFPIVKRKDEQKYGEYRTKRVILEIYDELQRAMETGEPYRTRLEPLPADPAVAHELRRESSEMFARQWYPERVTREQ